MAVKLPSQASANVVWPVRCFNELGPNSYISAIMLAHICKRNFAHQRHGTARLCRMPRLRVNSSSIALVLTLEA